jgi:hypothetical protein
VAPSLERIPNPFKQFPIFLSIYVIRICHIWTMRSLFLFNVMKFNSTTFNIISRKSILFEFEIAIMRIKFDLFIKFLIKLKNNFMKSCYEIEKLEQLKKLLNISKWKRQSGNFLSVIEISTFIIFKRNISCHRFPSVMKYEQH